MIESFERALQNTYILGYLSEDPIQDLGPLEYSLVSHKDRHEFSNEEYPD